MLNQERVSKIVLLILVFFVSFIFFVMIRQYLMPLFMAGLFSALLSPCYRKLVRRLGGRANLASFLLILAVFAVILVPMGILAGIIASEALHISQSVMPWVHEFINKPTVLNEHLEKLPFYETVAPYRAMLLERLGQAVGSLSSLCLNSLSSMTRMTFNAVAGIIIMFYAMFFLLVSGETLLRKILYFLPLGDEDEQLLLRRFTSVAAATLKGTLIIGVVQGAICGGAFSLTGIDGAAFWGAIMALLSIIPAVGAALIWVPAAIVTLVQGEFAHALILLVICGGVAGNADNFLRPRLVGKNTQMHELFVLFSTLGGISMFGILGVVVGPIIAALFITLWELYGKAFGSWLPAVGPLRQDGTEEESARHTALLFRENLAPDEQAPKKDGENSAASSACSAASKALGQARASGNSKAKKRVKRKRG